MRHTFRRISRAHFEDFNKCLSGDLPNVQPSRRPSLCTAIPHKIIPSAEWKHSKTSNDNHYTNSTQENRWRREARRITHLDSIINARPTKTIHFDCLTCRVHIYRFSRKCKESSWKARVKRLQTNMFDDMSAGFNAKVTSRVEPTCC